MGSGSQNGTFDGVSAPALPPRPDATGCAWAQLPLSGVQHDSAVPKGDDLRKAVHWISEQGRCTVEVVEEASRRFDLSPADEEFLLRTFLQAPEAS